MELRVAVATDLCGKIVKECLGITDFTGDWFPGAKNVGWKTVQSRCERSG